MKQAALEEITARNKVAPRRGAWIETPCITPLITLVYVAPRRGAWIETGGA